jgi:predicted RNA-binding protein with PUA-like domain
MKHWLMKSEPESYSIDDLEREKRTLWTGVRNYQARNFMTQSMSVGDPIFFYHSSTEPPCIAGLMRVSKVAAADPSQFDPKSHGYEPRAERSAPMWHCVEVEFVARAKKPLALEAMRAVPELAKMELLRKGSRLSIQPVEPAAFALVAKLAGLPKS